MILALVRCMCLTNLFLLADVQSDGTYHLKILVPSVAAGAIIGKGGETIAQLQKDTTARVKMSKANDFYPGEFLCWNLLCKHICISDYCK